MSEQAPKPKATRRYLGKIRNQNTQYGIMQKIYMDNLDAVKKDGTPNTFYKGALVWMDAETGKTYQVKQLSIFTPREGMRQEDVQRGNVAHITLNLDDSYEVTVLE